MISTFPDRLREAMRTAQKRPDSRRELHKALERAKVKGSSYPNVCAILNGKHEPNRLFIEGAAAVLGVSAAWLGFGEGPKTPAARVIDNSREAAGYALMGAGTRDGVDWVRREKALRAEFMKAFPSSEDAPDLWAAASRPWYYSQGRFASGAQHNLHGIEITEADERRAVRAVGRALNAPLKALHLDKPGAVSRWQMSHYVILVCAALESALIGAAEFATPSTPRVTTGKRRKRKRPDLTGAGTNEAQRKTGRKIGRRVKPTAIK